MLRNSARGFLKQALSLARVKLIYSRITLTRYTTLYFFTALFSCIVLCILQGVTYYDNYQARDLVQSLRHSVDTTDRLVVEIDGHLEVCNDFPGRAEANCTKISRKVDHSQVAIRDLDLDLFDLTESTPVRRQEEGESDSDSDDEGEESDDEGEESDDEGEESDDEEEEEEGAPQPGANSAPGSSATSPPSASGPILPSSPVPSSTSRSTTTSLFATSSVTVIPTSSGSVSLSFPTTLQATQTDSGSSQPAETPNPNAETGATPLHHDHVRVDTANGQVVMTRGCVQSLHWFADLVRDSQRGDIVTLVFELWLFSISVVAILNESLPHLFAALAAHVIGTSWATFRAANSKSQERLYRRLVVDVACEVDVLGGWWNQRHTHTYIIIGFNLLALILCSYLTFKLYKVYSSHSFRLAGNSTVLHTAYKRVLFLSVLLQLSGFFVLSCICLWIDKISDDEYKPITRHYAAYLAVFIIIAIVDIPWLVMGWISVRREHRQMFWVFSGLSLAMLVGPTFMFTSPLYRFVFGIWRFFAVMSVSAYILTVATVVAAIACRLQFGIGLKAYFKQTEEPEGHDFIPVILTPEHLRRTSVDSQSSEQDIEKAYMSNPGYVHETAPSSRVEQRPAVVGFPVPLHAGVDAYGASELKPPVRAVAGLSLGDSETFVSDYSMMSGTTVTSVTTQTQ